MSVPRITLDSRTRKKIREAIEKEAFIPRSKQPWVSKIGTYVQWSFDFRPLVLRGDILKSICDLFWKDMSKELPFQIGGLETTAIALTSALVLRAKENGNTIRGFYVRKSRRKDGFQKQIEGKLTDEKIVLVDDALNTGHSLMRVIGALEAEGKSVHAIWVLVRCRDLSYYQEFEKRNIKIYSVFTLEDFPLTGGLARGKLENTPRLSNPFSVEWKFESLDPSYFHVLPKSAPLADESRVYFGTDNGIFWALNQEDGSVAWSYKTLFGARKKRIFSSPALHDDIVYFGAYDGNFYALDAETGKRHWIYREADWIGSSPCIAPDLGLIYVGLEFGLWNKQGGIAALDAKSGEKRWWLQMKSYTHSSPAYFAKLDMVVVGGESGEVTAARASNGKILWTCQTGGAVKASFAFDEKRSLVAFGSWDRHIYVLDAKTGVVVFKKETLEPIYSTPVAEENRLYFGVLDKRMLCLDLQTGEYAWEFWTHSRVFSTPVIIEGHLFFGSNDGRLYELDVKTGNLIAFFQATERIVNRIAYNPTTKRFFVPTYANELYCLKKRI